MKELEEGSEFSLNISDDEDGSEIEEVVTTAFPGYDNSDDDKAQLDCSIIGEISDASLSSNTTVESLSNIRNILTGKVFCI